MRTNIRQAVLPKSVLLYHWMQRHKNMIQRAGERAFEALRMDVYSRADFIVSDADGEFYCLEMNCFRE